MMQAGAILGPIDRSGTHRGAGGGPITPNPVHDLNVPYEGTEEFETPTADLLFPPVKFWGFSHSLLCISPGFDLNVMIKYKICV